MQNKRCYLCKINVKETLSNRYGGRKLKEDNRCCIIFVLLFNISLELYHSFQFNMYEKYYTSQNTIRQIYIQNFASLWTFRYIHTSYYLLCHKIAHHYENMSMQYTVIFDGCKNDNFQMKNCNIFSYFSSKHRLWVHVRTASLRRF